MAEGGGIIEKAKLPFANYDIVVYFGVGICSLPLIFRYFLSHNGAKFPPLFSGYSQPLINDIVSIIALIFGVYILGHGVALISSIIVERFIYDLMGTPSNVITRIAAPQVSHPRTSTRDSSIAGLKKTYGNDPTPADIIRLLIHLPAMPLYFLMYSLRLFGFYESKISSFVVVRTQKRLEKCFDYNGSILVDPNWFKIVEYACANDHPVAMPKMYNYLMIYGIFRSISLLILLALWMELYYYFLVGGLGFIDVNGSGNIFVRLAVLYGAYLIAIMGFGKFSRRYSEEAVQAFALSKSFS